MPADQQRGVGERYLFRKSGGYHPKKQITSDRLSTYYINVLSIKVQFKFFKSLSDLLFSRLKIKNGSNRYDEKGNEQGHSIPYEIQRPG
jgi:hypothetical protein